MRPLLLFTIIIISSWHAALQSKAALTAADNADTVWQSINAPLDGLQTVTQALRKWGGENGLSADRSVDYWRWYEAFQIQKRERGLYFWNRFPEDKRKFNWLYETVMDPPGYWLNLDQGAASWARKTPELAIINHESFENWSKVYVRLRAELLADPSLDINYTVPFRYYEFMSRIQAADFTQKRGEHPDLPTLINELWDFSESVPSSTDTTEYYMKSLASFLVELLGSDPILEKQFIDQLKLSRRTSLQIFASGREQMRLLRGTPVDLTATAVDGQSIDLAKLRGKVVLLDFWSLSCSGCIAEMPHLKQVYDKYHGMGFEVISLCFEENKDKQKLNSLITRLQIPWPQSLQGRLMNSLLRDKYGIIGFPVTLLFDQNGLLVANDLRGQQLEREVRRLLGLLPRDVAQ